MFRYIVGLGLDTNGLIFISRLSLSLNNEDNEDILKEAQVFFENIINAHPDRKELIIANILLSISQNLHDDELSMKICKIILPSIDDKLIADYIKLSNFTDLVQKENENISIDTPTSKFLQIQIQELKEMDPSIFFLVKSRLLLNLFIINTTNFNEDDTRESIEYLVNNLSNLSDSQSKDLQDFLSLL